MSNKKHEVEVSQESEADQLARALKAVNTYMASERAVDSSSSQEEKAAQYDTKCQCIDVLRGIDDVLTQAIAASLTMDGGTANCEGLINKLIARTVEANEW